MPCSSKKMEDLSLIVALHSFLIHSHLPTGKEGEQSRAARIAKDVLGTEIDPKQPYGEVSLSCSLVSRCSSVDHLSLTTVLYDIHCLPIQTSFLLHPNVTPWPTRYRYGLDQRTRMAPRKS